MGRKNKNRKKKKSPSPPACGVATAAPSSGDGADVTGAASAVLPIQECCAGASCQVQCSSEAVKVSPPPQQEIQSSSVSCGADKHSARVVTATPAAAGPAPPPPSSPRADMPPAAQPLSPLDDLRENSPRPADSPKSKKKRNKKGGSPAPGLGGPVAKAGSPMLESPLARESSPAHMEQKLLGNKEPSPSKLSSPGLKEKNLPKKASSPKNKTGSPLPNARSPLAKPVNPLVEPGSPSPIGAACQVRPEAPVMSSCPFSRQPGMATFNIAPGSPCEIKKESGSPATKRKGKKKQDAAGQGTPLVLKETGGTPKGPSQKNKGRNTPTSPASPNVSSTVGMCPFMAGIQKAQEPQPTPAQEPEPVGNKSRKRQRVKVDEVAIEIVATDVCSSKTLGMSWDDVAFNDLHDLCEQSDDKLGPEEDMDDSCGQQHSPDKPVHDQAVPKPGADSDDDDDDACMEIEAFLCDEPLPIVQDPVPKAEPKPVYDPLPIDMTIEEDSGMPNIPKIEEEDEFDGMDFEPLLGDYDSVAFPMAEPASEPAVKACQASPPKCQSPGPMSYADAIRKSVKSPTEEEPEHQEMNLMKHEPRACTAPPSAKSDADVTQSSSSCPEFNADAPVACAQEVWACMQNEGMRCQQKLHAEVAEAKYMAKKDGTPDEKPSEPRIVICRRTPPVTQVCERPPGLRICPGKPSAPPSPPKLAPMKVASDAPSKDIVDSWKEEAEKLESLFRASVCEANYQESCALRAEPTIKTIHLKEEDGIKVDENANVRQSLQDSCNRLQEMKVAECCEGQYQQVIAGKKTLSLLTEDIAKEAEPKKGHRVNIIEIDEVATQTSPKKGPGQEQATQTDVTPTVCTKCANQEDLRGLLRVEMERRAEAEQQWRFSEHELHQLRQELTSKHRQSLQFEAEAIHVKDNLSSSTQMTSDLNQANQELEQALQASNIKIQHLQQQLDQGASFSTGVDLMLDLKLANSASKDAEYRLQLVQRDLSETKVQIKDLENENFKLSRNREDMIPMQIHQNALMKAEDRAYKAEMRVLQLEKEYIKLSHLQEVCLTPDSPSMAARLSWPSLDESIGKVSWASMAARKIDDNGNPQIGTLQHPVKNAKRPDNLAQFAAASKLLHPSAEQLGIQQFTISPKRVTPDLSTGEESDWSSSDSDQRRPPVHPSRPQEELNSSTDGATDVTKPVSPSCQHAERNKRMQSPPN